MAAPEWVGPESEKAGKPGAPSHLLGLRLGSRDFERSLMGGTVSYTDYTDTIIRRWETWATVLQRPKRPDPLDYQIDAFSKRRGRDALGAPPHQLRYLEDSSFTGFMGAMEFMGATGLMGFTGISSRGFT